MAKLNQYITIEVITPLVGDSFSPTNVRAQSLGVTTKRPVCKQSA